MNAILDWLYSKNNCPLLERLNYADDDPTCRISADKSGPDLEEHFCCVQEGQQVLHVLAVEVPDKPSHPFEGSVVDEPDDVADGGDKLRDEEWFVRVPKVSWNENYFSYVKLVTDKCVCYLYLSRTQCRTLIERKNEISLNGFWWYWPDCTLIQIQHKVDSTQKSNLFISTKHL